MDAKHHITSTNMGMLSVIYYDLKPCKIEATKDLIQINCTTISIDALMFLVNKHKELYPSTSRHVIQTGESNPQEVGLKY